jgi:hypothetical protein
MPPLGLYVEANLSRFRKTLKSLEGRMNKYIQPSNH